jgi:hypothetical protein
LYYLGDEGDDDEDDGWTGKVRKIVLNCKKRLSISPSPHCEKSLFFSFPPENSRITVRTENPAVDARIICLLSIEFF